MSRERIFQIIETAEDDDKASKVYDVTMMITIVASLVPLAFKQQTDVLRVVDKVTVAIFILDYILRLMTADYKLRRGKKSFAMYPATPMAIIDLITILPSLSILSGAFRLLKIIRLARTLRVFKFIRYSKSVQLLLATFKKQRDTLLTVVVLAVVYILISALVIFNVEPNTFNNYFDAVYWATISLTSVGYGDIYAVTAIGKIVEMVSAVFGIAIIALPSGIITAGFLEELNNSKNGNNDEAGGNN